jgi:hypothetical protein
MKHENYIALFALAALAFLFYNYNSKKGTSYMSSGGGVAPSAPTTDFASVSGMSTSTYGMEGGVSQPVNSSADLLPKDTNKQWSSMNPSGNGQLQGVNLMKAGSIIGINTVGSSLRNANLQVRSEPPNPQLNTGPWNQSTIDPDTMRTPLELHCGPQ